MKALLVSAGIVSLALNCAALDAQQANTSGASQATTSVPGVTTNSPQAPSNVTPMGNLEERKFGLEQRKFEEQKKASWLTLATVIVTAFVGFGTIVYNIRNSANQARLQARLKALEVVISAAGPETARERLSIVSQLLGGDKLPLDTGKNMKIKGVGVGHDQNRKDLIRMLVEHPDSHDDILALWEIAFGKTNLGKNIKSFKAYLSSITTKRFRESGVAFLSVDSDEFEERLIAAHQSFFDVFTQASKAAYNVLARLEPDRTDNVQLYWACAFARLCESCQAAAYLAARGFTQETAVEVRVALEVLLKMKAAIVKPDFAVEVINSDLFEQRKLVNLLLSGEAGELTPENRPEVEARKAEIEHEIATRNARKISIEEIAREVDGLGLYHNVYRLTSSNVHVSPRSLSRYLRLHPETGYPEQVVHGPSDAYTELHIHTVTEFLLIAISLLERHRQIPPPADFAAIDVAFRSLSPEWPEY